MSARPGEGGVVARIGVIADTHGTLSDAAREALAGVEAIVLAGDVGGGTVLDELQTIAPVTVVRGNCDLDGPAERASLVANVVLGGVRVIAAHRERDLGGSCDPVRAGARVAVTGHSHIASVEDRDGVLWVNPGSASMPRNGSAASVAIVTVAAEGAVSAEIVELP